MNKVPTKEEIKSELLKIQKRQELRTAQIDSLTDFYHDLKTCAAMTFRFTDFSDLKFCKKRAYDLFLMRDPRIFDKKDVDYSTKIFGRQECGFFIDPLDYKNKIEVLIYELFYSLCGKYKIEETHLLSSIIKYKRSNTFHIFGQSFYEIYRIVSRKDGVPYIYNIEVQYILSNPIYVIKENIKSLVNAIFNKTDEPFLSERPHTLKVPTNKIYNFDFYWDQAFKLYIRDTTKNDEEILDLLSKVETLQKNMVQKVAVKEHQKTKLYNIDELSTKIKDKIDERVANKLLDLREMIPHPPILFCDLNDVNNYLSESKSNIFRYPLSGVIGKGLVTDGTIKNHQYFFENSAALMDKLNYRKGVWAKQPLSTLHTKFINTLIKRIVPLQAKNVIGHSVDDDLD